ncbi:hypothetical protein CIK05_05875 [Bdellovibrio sp. qaytius]|nr:hypothetical protein CIK05_05875 [Bdellovibrio sp. qaytius]
MGASITFLEDNEELREVLAEVTRSELGEEALSFGRFDDLVAHRTEVLQTKMAILDINLGADQVTGVDVFHWLKDQGYTGKICFLTGHAKAHPMVQAASEIGAEIWAKPMYATTLCDAIRSVIKK